MAARRPSLLQKGGERREQGRAPPPRLALGELLSLDVAPDGRKGEPRHTRHSAQTGPWACRASTSSHRARRRAALVLRPFMLREAPGHRSGRVLWSGHWSGVICCRGDEGLRRLTQAAVFELEESLDALRHVLKEVEAVGDLHCLRRPLAHAVGIGLRPIPTHHVDFRMPA